MMPEYEPVKVPEDDAEYLWCAKHKELFRKGWRCRCCKTPIIRTIFDDWEPSCIQEPDPEFHYEPSGLGFGFDPEIPTGTHQMKVCLLHGEMYVPGVFPCPMCETKDGRVQF
jgi:hypothetical protein